MCKENILFVQNADLHLRPIEVVFDRTGMCEPLLCHQSRLLKWYQKTIRIPIQENIVTEQGFFNFAMFETHAQNKEFSSLKFDSTTKSVSTPMLLCLSRKKEENDGKCCNLCFVFAFCDTFENFQPTFAGMNVHSV